MLFAVGCGQPSTLPPNTTANVPPDPKLWEGKDINTAVADYLSAASIFTAALKKIKDGPTVTVTQPEVVEAARKLRVARFALADISKGKAPDPDTAAKLNEASGSVSQEVARLLEIPEAKRALHEPFMLVRTAPAPQF